MYKKFLLSPAPRTDRQLAYIGREVCNKNVKKALIDTYSHTALGQLISISMSNLLNSSSFVSLFSCPAAF